MNSSEREIWYITDNIDKRVSVNIVVIENGTFTKYALAGSGISLGDCAKLTDDEVVAKAEKTITLISDMIYQKWRYI